MNPSRTVPALFGIAMLLASAVAFAQEAPKPRYIIKEDEARVGSNVRRASVTSDQLPINLSYEQLSEADRSKLHAQYAGFRDGDEPPFPLKGLQAIYEPLDKDPDRVFDRAGLLHVVAMVGTDGRVRKMEVIDAPSNAAATFAAKVLSEVEFKPARCAGEPCEVGFGVRLAIKRRF